MDAHGLWLPSLAFVFGVSAGCAPHSPPSNDASNVDSAPASAEAVSARPRAQAEMTPTEESVNQSDVPDATTTDPDKYQMVMENAQVRVLRYHDVPGTKTHQHRHPDSVLYALSSFTRVLHFPDGTTRERSFQTGDVMWVPAQTHVGENVGKTATEVLLVEIKTPPTDPETKREAAPGPAQ